MCLRVLICFQALQCAIYFRLVPPREADNRTKAHQVSFEAAGTVAADALAVAAGALDVPVGFAAVPGGEQTRADLVATLLCSKASGSVMHVSADVYAP